MASSKKKLNMAAVKKQDKKFSERYEVDINGYVLEIDKTFRKTKITALINELIEKFEETRIRDTSILEIFAPYVILLMMKNFTSLDIPQKLEDQLKTMDFLIDNEFFVPIYENMPKEEINKVYAELNVVTDRINENLADLMAATDELDLENREALGLD